MTGAPVFTVFTPTYNRVATLTGVYSSLQAQTFRNFEWLIVDDGSADGTTELVRDWQCVTNFPIRYYWQPNGGKHRAFNRGVQEARGEFFLTLDSDDKCVPEALERLKFHWDAIPAECRERYSAVTALCADAQGQVVGDRFPQGVFDSNSLAIRYRHRIAGEKWGFQRTAVLRRFPYPEFPGESFIPESVVWNRIAGEYCTRYVNEALRIYEPGADSLSRRSVRLRMDSLQGCLLLYRELLLAPLPALGKLKAAANYVRFSLHGRRNPSTIFAESGAPAWIFSAFVVGYWFYWRDGRQVGGGS